jgi:hypothetical protein
LNGRLAEQEAVGDEACGDGGAHATYPEYWLEDRLGGAREKHAHCYFEGGDQDCLDGTEEEADGEETAVVDAYAVK